MFECIDAVREAQKDLLEKYEEYCEMSGAADDAYGQVFDRIKADKQANDEKTAELEDKISGADGVRKMLLEQQLEKVQAAEFHPTEEESALFRSCSNEASKALHKLRGAATRFRTATAKAKEGVHADISALYGSKEISRILNEERLDYVSKREKEFDKL